MRTSLMAGLTLGLVLALAAGNPAGATPGLQDRQPTEDLSAQRKRTVVVTRKVVTREVVTRRVVTRGAATRRVAIGRAPAPQVIVEAGVEPNYRVVPGPAFHYDPYYYGPYYYRPYYYPPAPFPFFPLIW